jgi:GT2 family glycosyltransferase
VVVPTCGRPEELARCLRSLGGLDYPAYDVVVVDNAVDAATSQVVHDAAAAGLRVRYVPEPRRGASRARNTGVEAARGEIIAFTDDDVAVDPDWLRRLVAGFGRGAGVSCVTGLTMPLELETPAQVWFESYGGFAQGFEPRLYDLRDNRGSTLLYPYTAGAFGASNNLAVLRSTFLAHGGFDERLGPGTPTHSAEDQDLLLAVILSGARIAYEPRAIVRHAHRRDEQALRQQVFRYSVGMTALLTKWVVSDPRVRRDLAHRAPRVLPLALARGRGVGSAAPSYPGWLRRRERAGFLVGPAAYWRSWAVSAHAESVSR